jgi:hypothetical protein
MSTLHKLRAAVHRLQIKHITKAKARRYRCGVAALSLSAFTSLNAAGRRSSHNRWTGESKMRRLVTDARLSDQLQQLLLTEAFTGRKGYWYCSMDHSQFGPFCIAVLAISNRAGRAIPIWIQVNVSEAALIAPLLQALEELLSFLSFIAPNLKLVLVMDRWFAADKLFELITRHGAYFIARTKSDKKVQTPWDQYWQRSPIREISPLESSVIYRKHRLRLIRSELKIGMKDPEPWFLLTNLLDKQTKGDVDGVSRRQLLNRYAERFEIEEAFKDIKWLQRLEWQQIRKPAVIRSLLLFAFLGWWLLWRYGDKQIIAANTRLHPKKRLSWFRLAWEHLQTAMTAQLCLLT